MGIKQAIGKAKSRARKEATTNDYSDSMMFVVKTDIDSFDKGRYIVMDEWHYDTGQGAGDIDQAVATVWSDGEVVEVERYI